MFTGLIRTLGKVEGLEPASGGLHLEIRPLQNESETFRVGESIAVDGVCLTATSIENNSDQAPLLKFYISPETLERTRFSHLSVGDGVHLERSLRLSDRLEGHLVQGHVDGTGKVSRLSPKAEGFELEIEIPPRLWKYVIEKGSIAINGVSLTINSLASPYRIQLFLIPHTWTETFFSSLKVGIPVNVEVDVFAKWAERFQNQETSKEISL